MDYEGIAENRSRSFSFQIWAKMLPFIRPYYRQMALVILMMLFAAAVEVSNPLLQAYAIDHFIVAGTTQGLLPFLLFCLGLLLLQSAGTVLFFQFALKIEMYLGRDLKQATFSHLQTLSFSYYNITPVGFIVARVISDTDRIGAMFSWSLVDVFWSLAYVFGAFVSMFVLNAKMALIVLLIVPFIAILTFFFQRKVLQAHRQIRHTNAELTRAYNEGISGAKTTKTLVIEDKNTQAFSQTSAKMRAVTIHAKLLHAVYLPLVLFCSSLAVAFVLVQGGYLSMEGAMQLGIFSAFINYALSIFEPIQQLARVLANFISVQASIERVTDLLERKPDVTDTPDVLAKYGTLFAPKRENWEPVTGAVTFEDVSFQYPDGIEEVLSHFNLHVPPGTTVALVGETGAGKSTLVNLVCRFFEPTQGRILIDGVDYRKRGLLWLHSHIGYVLQTPHLFSGTIRENIRYGRLDATDAEVEHAARTVNAHDFISRLPNGYDSSVGEGGNQLSTGEKQLLSFARAVLTDPRLFILDEATSSIDTKTEKFIQDALSHLLANRTSFVIAHRLSTIRRADFILVVQDGKIIEQGTHKDLIQKRGRYFSLYRRQCEQEITLHP